VPEGVEGDVVKLGRLHGVVVGGLDVTGLEDSAAAFRTVLSLAEPRGMRALVAHCHLGLGKLYLSTDKREQAREHLATATTMYRDMGMTYWLEKAEAELQRWTGPQAAAPRFDPAQPPRYRRQT
jgi:hypothetical protein